MTRADSNGLLGLGLSILSTLLVAFNALNTPLAHANDTSALILDDADFYPRNPAQEALGRLLFFDKLLSGNQDIACATCHHPLLGSGDGLSLSLGAGADGLGPMRRPNTVSQRVPRNAPPLYNLGAREFTALFHDGRLQIDPSQPGGLSHPEAVLLPPGLDNILAAQAMLSVISVLEMAGDAGANPISAAVLADRLAGPDGAWDRLAQRLRANDNYVALFRSAFPVLNSAADIQFSHAANALAAFIASAFRCTGSLFDQVVRGDKSRLYQKALDGAALFYGKAGCGNCHSGPLQTDHQFHAIGLPQIGPGRGDNQPDYFDGLDDFGREQVTGNSDDRFRFRTPSLRNVTLTGPWGHDGAYNDLEQMVRHHLDPINALENYNIDQAVLPSALNRPDLNALDGIVQADAARRQAIGAASELAPQSPSDTEIDALMEFLHALTDRRCSDLRHLIPNQVPSGLPVAD